MSRLPHACVRAPVRRHLRMYVCMSYLCLIDSVNVRESNIIDRNDDDVGDRDPDPDSPMFSLVTGKYRHAKRFGGKSQQFIIFLSLFLALFVSPPSIRHVIDRWFYFRKSHFPPSTPPNPFSPPSLI